jgi:hypothetical protein
MKYYVVWSGDGAVECHNDPDTVFEYLKNHPGGNFEAFEDADSALTAAKEMEGLGKEAPSHGNKRKDQSLEEKMPPQSKGPRRKKRKASKVETGHSGLVRIFVLKDCSF